jgi:hypothetical protein
VPQGRTGRCVGGHAAKQCRITALVRVGRPYVPPAGVFAWRRELVPHASLPRGLVCRGGATFAWTVSWSETETVRANGQVVGGEEDTPRRSHP